MFLTIWSIPKPKGQMFYTYTREYITLKDLIEKSEIDQQEVVLYLLKQVEELERERARLRYATSIRVANQEPDLALFQEDPERIAEWEAVVEERLEIARSKRKKPDPKSTPQSQSSAQPKKPAPPKKKKKKSNAQTPTSNTKSNQE